ncbi:hypothetical protein [Streptomyces sp. NRRL F-5053]|uniref:hypothetical protein n=1 Tax=Streptomyces sp. NRRL F-5053 TaxID=1463854 RepID=UPI0004C59D21|nr:hypothetical protein [Streptomyces sp. NRRL F-5053]
MSSIENRGGYVRTTEQDPYGAELARISQHHSDAATARIRLFAMLARAGVTREQADELVATVESGAIAGAHTIISENSPSAAHEEAFQDGWFAGIRSVASQLLGIADHTAAQRGHAHSVALLLDTARPEAALTPEPSRTTALPPLDTGDQDDDAAEVGGTQARACTSRHGDADADN